MIYDNFVVETLQTTRVTFFSMVIDIRSMFAKSWLYQEIAGFFLQNILEYNVPENVISM